MVVATCLRGVGRCLAAPDSTSRGREHRLASVAGIFIGLSFAWAGNAQALMQTAEIEAMTEKRAGGFREYAFAFQTAVLTILVTLGLWGAAGLGILDRRCFWSCSAATYFLAKAVLFFAASLTLREYWHVVLGAQWMLLSQHRIKRRPAEALPKGSAAELPEDASTRNVERVERE
jgi:hypothetical protein